MEQPSGPLVRSLRGLGLDPSQVETFLRGEAVVYQLPTQGEAGIAMIQLAGIRLRSGIIEINDVGGGVKDFLVFRGRSEVVARALGASELELFGGAVINQKLESLLLRRGFQRGEDTVPEDLGGGTMEILIPGLLTDRTRGIIGMDDFSEYEKMRDSGSSPKQVHEAGKADGLDPITLIRLLRKVFNLTYIDAKKAIGAAEWFNARPLIRVGSTAQWEVFGPEENTFLMEAIVASIEGGMARLERIKKYRLDGDKFVEVLLEGPDHGEIAVSDLERPLVERLEAAFRVLNEPARIQH